MNLDNFLMDFPDLRGIYRTRGFSCFFKCRFKHRLYYVGKFIQPCFKSVNVFKGVFSISQNQIHPSSFAFKTTYSFSRGNDSDDDIGVPDRVKQDIR